MTQQLTNKTIPKLIELVKPDNYKQYGTFKRKLMENFCKEHKLLSFATNAPKNVAHFGGERSYMLLGSLARLERALSKWSMNELIVKHKFTPVVVPNIIHDNVIDRCGFPTRSKRSQVYKISATSEKSIFDELREDSENVTHSCLAGTSEFALASIHIGDKISFEDLPKKYCALSRCYRAETSNTAAEWGIYRVHYFNKVEMLALTMPDRSEDMHREFLQIQRDLFNQLGLSYKVLDMPEDDLGLSAAKKYDIEAWMEGRQRYGEISSTSNCKDYQTSRLNIKYTKMVERNNQLQVDSDYVHSINGTACSSIRTMIAIIEQNQTEDGKVEIPKPLLAYMNGATHIPDELDKKQLEEVNFIPEHQLEKETV